MRKISKLRFYRSGEIVRDLGIVYFYTILQEMKSYYNKDYEITLTDNFLEFVCDDYSEVYQYIINVKVFENFMKGVKAELQKKKINEDFFRDVNIGNFIEMVASLDQLNTTEKEKLKNSFKSKYMPYIRNSPKYGANSQSEKNFHKNFNELVRLVFELNGKELEDQIEILDKYKSSGDICCICHSVYSTKFDISHKSEQKTREVSKYNYMFMGAENSTFNNYGNAQSSVCFVCEFFNLMFLLYFSLVQPRTISYVDSLQNIYFFNQKINNLLKLYNDQGFYKKLSQYNAKNIRLYSIKSDPNKGLILKMEQVLKYDEFIKQIELYHIINQLSISSDASANMQELKRLVISRNYKVLKDIFISIVLYFDRKEGKRTLNITRTVSNIRLLLEMLKIEYGEEGKNWPKIIKHSLMQAKNWEAKFQMKQRILWGLNSFKC
ncbi:hypothetical protein [Acetivibrio straminisolvens]|uniref:Uncharacterized protein n=1 Tax=Acetivibrio straminisolvens JCM 21531 TaxID=1294263 RepID=W4VCX1_9FIRM|nr:hypothetical protein [Acetivibrio straminisolvens]GAE90643.1 hypothetical protein JCM21531_4271 [Acetivibrio straminisolvens JCM 21531]